MTYTNKTQPTTIDPRNYLEKNFTKKENIKKDTEKLIDLYAKATGSKCVMWNRIFGFGKYHYQDSKGGQHIYMTTGFAISSTGFTLYNMIGWGSYKNDLTKLGKFKLTGKSCLAIKSIDDIDTKLLQKLVKKSVQDMKKKYKTEK